MSVKSQLAGVKALINRTRKDNAEKYQREISVGILQGCAIDTPVDTGNATASWVASVGSRKHSVGGIINESGTKHGTFDTSSDAKATAEKARRALQDIPWGETVYISNDASFENPDGTNEYYILNLENGGSSQAPNGFFYKNLALAKNYSRKAKRKLGL